MEVAERILVSALEIVEKLLATAPGKLDYQLS
jgi:hypothetical protein